MRKLLLILFGILFINQINSQSLFGVKKSISTSTGALPNVIESDDLNNDSFIDIVIGTSVGNTVEWYRNNANGTFSLQTLISSTLSNVNGLAIADLDNDNDKDIIASSNFDDKVVWFENDGAGNFGPEQLISATGLMGVNTVKAGDIDNNGTIDVVASAYSSDVVQWYSNDGSGSFGSAQPISTLTNSGPRDFDLGDYDNDGDLDVVIGYGKTYLVKLFNNNLIGSGSVSFTAEANNVSINDFYITDVSFGDVDNNGDLEILKVNLYTNPAWYNKESNGTFTENILSTSNTNPWSAKISDLNDDSSNDVSVGYSSSSSTDPLTWYEDVNPSGEVTIDNTQNDIYNFTINDFDNDGDLDMASISGNENHLNWFENTTYASSLSTEDFDNSIKHFYNASTESLTIESINENFSKVELYNILGQSILTKNLSRTKEDINLSQQVNGIYIARIFTQDAQKSIKFIKH